MKKLLSPVTGLAAHRCPSNSTLAFTLCHTSSAEQRQKKKKYIPCVSSEELCLGSPWKEKGKEEFFHGIEAEFQMLLLPLPFSLF